MKQDVIYITGHKNPDSDSICSSLAYAELKRKQGINAVARRLGEIGRETAFILDYFNAEPPELLTTVKTQLSDLDIDVVNPVSPGTSIKSAWNIMKKTNTKNLPVIDEHDRFQGVVTISNITEKYMDALDNNTIAASKTTLSNILETLNAKLICGTQADFKTTGRVVVIAMDPGDLAVEPGDIAIAGTRKDNQLRAAEMGAACIIVTNNGAISDELIKIAKEKKTIVMVTQSDTYVTARLINQSIPVNYVMSSKDIVKFYIDDFVDDIKEKMLQTRYRSYPVLDENERFKGFLTRYHLLSRRKKKIILMDHNEKAQSVNGIEDAEILEIIDHHRLGDISTSSPILFKCEPVGSTSTIVANLYVDAGIRPSKTAAGLLCSAILSDTLKFKSPTCTYTDKITAEKLAEIAGINIDDYADQMFRAASTLEGKSPKEILYQDFKEFKINKFKVGIAQVFTTDPEALAKIKVEMLDYMGQACKEQGLDFIVLLVTDIFKEGSDVYHAGVEKALIASAFDVQFNGDSAFLPGIVSRKKQVVPKISSAADKM